MVGGFRTKALMVLSEEETDPSWDRCTVAVVATSCYMLSDRWHPRFRNLNSTVSADVVKVKSYVSSLSNSTSQSTSAGLGQ